MMAAGGTQLKKIFEDDGDLRRGQFHVDWNDPSKTKVTGPVKIRGRAVSLPVRRPADQLRAAAGHRSAARRAGRQDHGARSSIAASTDASRSSPCIRSTPRRAAAACAGTSSGSTRQRNVRALSAGHVRARRLLPLDGEPGDRQAGQHRRSATRSAARRTSPASASPARLANDPPGVLTLARPCSSRARRRRRTRCAGKTTRRRAIDPSDDCTIWYVGDYLKKDATSYSTKIGAVRVPGCR